MTQRRPPARACALLLLLVCGSAGCSSMEQARLSDEGLALEEQAVQAEGAGDAAGALDRFRQSEAKFREARAIAEEKQNATTLRYVRMKLAHVLAGQARAQQPGASPQGRWEDAKAAFAAAAAMATEGQFLKLAREYTLAEAGCVLPEQNPAGSWTDAAALYARAAELSKGFDDDDGQGAALREQARCLMKGKHGPPRGEARELLEEARRLGDALAKEWLAVKAVCAKCQAPMPAGARFCPECGAEAGPTICPECHAELTPGARFCAKCGAKAK